MLNIKEKLLKVGEVLWRTFCEFCESSSINGVRYITERRFHWVERIWWIIAVAASFGMCGILIHNTWTEWQKNLIKLNTLDKSVIVENIPFPTVTVCPLAKTAKHKFDLSSQFIRAYEIRSNLSDRDYFRLNTLAHVCPSFHNQLQFKNHFTDESIYRTMIEIAPDIDYVLKDCRWLGKPFDCSKHFVPVFLNQGVCFSFNALNSREFYTKEMAPQLMTINNNPNISRWGWDIGYNSESNGNEYPWRVIESGLEASLEVSLIAHEQDHTALCNSNEDEFVIVFSVPGESMNVHDFKEFNVQVPVSTNSLISMEAEVTVTSDALRNYSPNERDCYYSSERRLAFFQIYSVKNCFIECLANFTVMHYDCVPFYMPRFKDTKLCGDAYVKDYIFITQKLMLEGAYWKKCDCLKSCTFIRYVPKLDAAKYSISAKNAEKKSSAKYSGIKISKLAIFFKDRHLKCVLRKETSTYPDFLAVCGGLLGLFLGMTTLSIIEVFYYLSLRLFWNIRNVRAQNSVTPVDQEISGPSNSEDNNCSPINANDDNWFQANRCQEAKLSHAMIETAKEFCNNGCIHGIQYIAKESLHWMERFMWSIAILLYLGLCGYLIRNIWKEWSENPVIMISSQNLTAIVVPHPAITLCPDTKTLKNKFDISFALKNLHNLSAIEEDQVKALAHICPILADQLKTKDEYMSESIFNIIGNLSLSFAESVFSCDILGLHDKCWNLLIPMYTDEGLCLTFNNLNSHEIYTDSMAPGMMTTKNNPNVSGWSLESGYTDQRRNVYPRRARFQNTESVIGLMIDKNHDNQCKDVDEGVKVMISVPGDSFVMSRNYFRAPLSKITQIKIFTKITTTSETLRHYTPSQRQCYYSYERQLKFFKNYTQNNCEAECSANFTRAECGCVKFSMPRDRSTKICGKPNIMCYRKAEKKITASGSVEKSKCNCLPTCKSIEYSAVIERINLDGMAIKKTNQHLKDRLLTGIAFSQYNEVQKEHRQERYSWTEFLSICGGFLGLFLGMSALSLIEIVYYATIRLFCTYRRLKSEPKINLPTIVISQETIDDLSLHSI